MSSSDFQPEIYQLFDEGNQLFSKGKREEAIAAFTRLLEQAPQFFPAYVQRGLALQELGRVNEALFDHQRAIRINPNYGPAYYGRGWARNWLKDYKGELEDGLRGLQLDPDNTSLYRRRIGAAYSGLGQYERAIQEYTRALAIDAQD
jgi:tetratricopeptide (TPR) repeat protein